MSKPAPAEDQPGDLLFGLHAVRSALEQANLRVRTIWLQKAFKDNDDRSQLASQAAARKVRVEWVSKTILDRMTASANHQGVAAQCHALALASEADLVERWSAFGSEPLILILDGVMDPGNLGACLRSALGAGVDAVLLPKRRSAPLTGAAMKASSGAAEQLLLVSVTNLARRIEWLKAQGVWIIGATGDAPMPWFEAPWQGAAALVMGGEGEGLKRLTREKCDYLVHVPLAGGLESLNVSVATGVVLFEAIRQRCS